MSEEGTQTSTPLTAAPEGTTAVADSNPESSQKQELYVSKAQKVADEIEAEAFGKPEEEKPAEETESQEETEEAKPAEAGETEESREESPTSEEKIKGGVQKRIDQLVAKEKAALEDNSNLLTQNRELENRLSRMEGRLDEQVKPKGETKDQEFTPGQLMSAMKKAMDEGDVELMNDVMTYREQMVEKKLTKNYEDDKAEQRKVITDKQEDWKQIESKFSEGSYGDDFLDKDSDFNIKNQTSLLYKMAKKFYDDPELAVTYQGKGGMGRAVDEAFKEVLLFKTKNVGTTKEAPKPSNPSAKKERKASLGDGASDSGGSNVAKPSGPKDSLSDYIKERKDFSRSRMTTAV